MSRAIVKRPLADLDLIGHYAFLDEQANLETADRFLNAVEKTLELIAKSPGIGSVYRTSRPKLTELRFLPVSKFRRFLLFYQAFDDRIDLVRVIHGARNLKKIHGLEPDE